MNDPQLKQELDMVYGRLDEVREALRNLIESWHYDGDLTRYEIEKAQKVLDG